jgi:hypothetical protein
VGKINAGEVIGEAFRIYRSQFVTLLLAALAVFLISGLAVLVLPGLLAIIAALVVVAAAVFYQGAAVQLVHDVQDGRRDYSLGELFKSVAPVAVPLLLVAILAGIGIAIGFVLLIIPGLILLTIWSVVAPVVVVENPGVFAAFGRSRELVRGNGWQVFGVIVLVYLILIVISLAGAAIGAPLGDVGRAVVNWLVTALTAPMAAVVAAVLYFRLRALKNEATTDAAPAPPESGTVPGPPAGAEG